MVKIIIVEDEEKWMTEYERVINNILFKTDKEYEIYKFKKYNNELRDIINDNSEQKIYLMDLELDPKHTGMDILREIREEDWDSEIIVLTNHDRMFETVHKEIYKTFDFIEKFDNFESRLIKDLKKIFNKKHDKDKFIYDTKKIKLQIYLKDILYIYRDTVDRKLIIKTSNNEFVVNLTMNEILSMLDNRFIQCHRSCIINNDRITEKNYAEGYFTTDTGEKVDLLSRKFKEEE
ncbi:MAG: LytTR family transcriptional regulator DNA-binding domain-containing protein [Bacilli bacterium]|nr:LytTR family transcriptional regulator DNA-binding domain-containing protein [Bacilli bacterium]